MLIELERAPAKQPANYGRQRVAYLVPEFPGQTDIFYWREIKDLEKLNVDVCLFSTRQPDKSIRSHLWTKEAVFRTTYLRDLPLRDLLASLKHLPVLLQRDIRRSLVKAGPRAIVDALLSLTFATKLVRSCHNKTIAHVHAHSCGRTALICALANRIGNIDYSLTLHGPMQDYGNLQDLKWRRAKFATVITQRLLREVQTALGSDMPDRVVVQGMGIDPNRLKRPTSYVPYEGQGKLRIFSCGRLHVVKGHQILIDAAAKLSDRGIDLEVFIAGQDEHQGNGFKKVLQQQINELGLKEKVHLLGAVSDEEVRQQLLACHIFALASFSEPLGVVYMEAMSCEVPTIATHAGGVPELIDHDVDGLLVPPHDADALANQIEQLAASPSKAEKLATNGRRKVEKRFSSMRGAQTLARLTFG
ncbi:MAG: exopolysaccharide biosynthesis GT4 family glycosyltransferase EpsE [Pseudomonadota bacterium]